MREGSESEQALHALIRQAEDTAREIRVLSSGYLSLAVVRNHGKSLAEREGLGWHDAHEAAARVFTAPDSVTDAVLDNAVIAYKTQRGVRPSLTAALAAVNLDEPEYLDTATRAFRYGYFGTRESLRQALVAVIETRQKARLTAAVAEGEEARNQEADQ